MLTLGTSFLGPPNEEGTPRFQNCALDCGYGEL
jgi:hypothetical protein